MISAQARQRPVQACTEATSQGRVAAATLRETMPGEYLVST